MAAGRSLEVAADPGTIWRIWSDAAHWPEWNPNVPAISLDGAFAEGTTGTMSTSAGRTHKIRLAEVNPPRSFRLDAWPIPATTFHFDCRIEPRAGGGSVISQSVSIGGLGGILGAMMAPRVAGTFTPILEALKKKAEAAGAAASDKG